MGVRGTELSRLYILDTISGRGTVGKKSLGYPAHSLFHIHLLPWCDTECWVRWIYVLTSKWQFLCSYLFNGRVIGLVVVSACARVLPNGDMGVDKSFHIDHSKYDHPI